MSQRPVRDSGSLSFPALLPEADLARYIREEMRKGFDKVFLEEITGPAIWGDGNFEIYLDDDGEWQIRSAPHFVQAELVGILNTSPRSRSIFEKLG